MSIERAAMATLEAKKPLFSLQIEKPVPQADVTVLSSYQPEPPIVNSAMMTDLTVVTVKNLRPADLKAAAQTLKAIEQTSIDRLAIARALNKGHNYPMATTKGSEVFTNLDPHMTGGSTYGEHSIMSFKVRSEEQETLALPGAASSEDFSKALMMNDRWYLEKSPNTPTERAVVDMMVVLEQEQPITLEGYLENRPGHIKPAEFFLPELDEAA